jgi:phage tail-like protein
VPKPEFLLQIIATEAQWRAGIAQGLEIGANGIALFATAAFESLFSSDVTSAHLGDIVTDECGQTWWTEETSRGRWTLMRHDPRSNQTERVLSLNPCGPFDPSKLWLTCDYLFILDDANARVIAYSRENFQPLFEVPGVHAGVDIDFDGRSAFYTLETAPATQICRYPLPPAEGSDCFALQHWQKPVALAAAPDGKLYVLDSALGRFIRVNPADRSQELLGAQADPRLLYIQPAAMDIDPRGVIFVATSTGPHLYQFAPDGSFLAEVDLPDGITSITGIGFDAAGNVFLATNEGVARLSLSIASVGQRGYYYTRTLDNGNPQGLWHQLVLEASLPPKTAVEVQYVPSSNDALKAAVDAVFASTDPVQEKVARIESLLGPLWNNPPENFPGSAAAANPDMLFVRNQGRYLWVKLALVTSDRSNRPAVRVTRIYYPRLSYLRYLPAAYRDDPVSAAFLERFLSLFETVFRGIEGEVDTIYRYFDPAAAPAGFLPWLASWVDLAIDEGLPTDRVRKLIARAPVLYQRKGTPAGLIEFLEIYTGSTVALTEFGQNLAPLVLGAGITLGSKLLIASSPVRAYRVGDSSIVGYTPLRAQDGDPSEPFRTFAQRFEIVLNMPPDEFRRSAAALARVLDEQKPAHTSATIRNAADGAFLGEQRLGINTVIGGPKAYRVGYTRLGEGGAFGKSKPALLVDRGAWVGSPLRLEPDR